MRAYERFLNYVPVWTTSDETSDTVPSADRELVLARMLVEEMKGLGIADARVDDKGYVYGHIPATPGCEDKPSLGLVAHMDTVADASGENIKPQIIENYDGKDVVLKGSGDILKVDEFPYLAELKGRTLITTDGTTLLGADDKAGIAEILTVAEEIIKEGLPHGKICIGFTPDEEIARGAKHFDVEGFGADYAYTLDGDEEGEIQFENFNASTAFITIHGVSVHTGSAKDVMVNSQTIATEIHQMLPVNERPETTEGYEGFYHLVSVQGNVTTTKMKYFIRDFDRKSFDARAQKLRDIAEEMNKKYGEGKVEVEIVESYYNMREKIEPCMQLIDYAKAAIEHAGITPIVSPVRGGTDGARLSFKGLPCPNLGTGGHAFHGVFEHITVEGMDKAVLIVKDIIRQFAE
ncbi:MULTISPECIES: peptidase T [Lachnospiraceae]|jgi:tripeptide aminopeptidase|uniref:Peptidase T n=1 Tax=Coprococcus comes TaxID=410072 RepID=A0A412QNB2_9FIRM|nr:MULTISPECIES: peptidase T [Coprococcus]MBU5248383.1 peptidase T [Coprococcus comes]NSF18296.1 peptidase T [Coprococcus comes]RGT92440.1 peptidase T [Coprococcus comes]